MINTKEDYAKAYDLIKKEEEHRESFLGGHFISTYQKCPWMFFLKYVMGFAKDTNPRYFIRGQAIHSAIEHFLSGLDENVVQQIPIAYLYHNKDRYQDDTEFSIDLSLVTEGIIEWLSENRSDLSTYEEVEHEVSHTIYLSNGFPLTIRMDRLVRSLETGRLYVIDTKTTKSNMTNILRNLRQGIQGISYMFAVHQLYKEWPAGVIGDILMMRANKYSNNIQSYRSPPITYSMYAFIQWEMNMIGLLSEISQKVKTFYDASLPEEVLFPRNPDACSFMGCPFEDICRRRHSFDVIPDGYKRDPWVDEEKVLSLIKDRSYMDKMLYDLVVKRKEDFYEKSD